jgi:Transposase zinc-binding domain
MPLSGSPAPSYEPRTPETSVLYRTVHAHLEAFLVCTAGEEGRPGLPGFVKREFEAYLRCGILTHGFARVRCEGCAFEHLVPFSCCLDKEAMRSSMLRPRL